MAQIELMKELKGHLKYISTGINRHSDIIPKVLYSAILITGISVFVGNEFRLIHRLENKVDSIESKLTLHYENVIGGPEKDKFYEIGGLRSYIEIDGKPIEKYIPNEH